LVDLRIVINSNGLYNFLTCVLNLIFIGYFSFNGQEVVWSLMFVSVMKEFF